MFCGYCRYLDFSVLLSERYVASFLSISCLVNQFEKEKRRRRRRDVSICDQRGI